MLLYFRAVRCAALAARVAAVRGSAETIELEEDGNAQPVSELVNRPDRPRYARACAMAFPSPHGGPHLPGVRGDLDAQSRAGA